VALTKSVSASGSNHLKCCKDERIDIPIRTGERIVGIVPLFYDTVFYYRLFLRHSKNASKILATTANITKFASFFS